MAKKQTNKKPHEAIIGVINMTSVCDIYTVQQVYIYHR